MRRRSSRPAALLRLIREREVPVQLQPVQLLQPIAGACVGRGGCCFLVTGFSLYPYTSRGVHSFPRELPGCSLLTRPYIIIIVAYTHQAIVVLLAKLTNAPTKLHTGCIVLWGSGACLHSCYNYVECIFFCIVLIIMPLLETTLSHTYIS